MFERAYTFRYLHWIVLIVLLHHLGFLVGTLGVPSLWGFLGDSYAPDIQWLRVAPQCSPVLDAVHDRSYLCGSSLRCGCARCKRARTSHRVYNSNGSKDYCNQPQRDRSPPQLQSAKGAALPHRLSGQTSQLELGWGLDPPRPGERQVDRVALELASCVARL